MFSTTDHMTAEQLARCRRTARGASLWKGYCTRCHRPVVFTAASPTSCRGESATTLNNSCILFVAEQAKRVHDDRLIDLPVRIVAPDMAEHEDAPVSGLD